MKRGKQVRAPVPKPLPTDEEELDREIKKLQANQVRHIKTIEELRNENAKKANRVRALNNRLSELRKAPVNNGRKGGKKQVISKQARDEWQEYQDFDLTYEEMLALGEHLGKVEVGLDPRIVEQIPIVNGTGEDICSICMDEIRVGEPMKQIPQCQHTYHPECIDKWLSTKKTCPMCLVDLDE